MITARIIAGILGYAFGNISMGLIIAKIYHVDIRREGSGNVGGTNVARSIGAGSGLITVTSDCLKAVIPALIIWAIYRNDPAMNVGLLMIYAGFGAVIGHMLPVVLKFKGGKGIATTLGFMIVSCPWSILINVTLFFAIAIITKYVSLGSVIAVGLLPVTIGVFLAIGVLPYTGFEAIEVIILFCIDAVIAIFMHRQNIKRLLSGTENKFSIKKKEKKEN